MKFVHAKDLRTAEQAHLAGLGDGARAVERAWVGEVGGMLADAVAAILEAQGRHMGAIILAGPGMNGADGLAAALALHRAGYRCEVWSTCEAGNPDGLRAALADECQKQGIEYEELAEQALAFRPLAGRRVGVLVDAIFGSGFHGEPSGREAEAMAFLREAWPGVVRVAMDVPSGWDGETLPVSPFIPAADLTVTAGRPKPGMATAEGLSLCGRVVVAPFGLPDDALAPMEMPALRENGVTDLLSGREIASLLPRRRASAAHKGNFGRLLLLGGCESYPGAITLCALGALRSGVGMVYVGTSATARTAIAARVPCAIPDDDLFSTRDWNAYGAFVLGPGLGQSPEARRIVASSLYGAGSPMVVDADAISLLAGRPEALRSCGRPAVITPHVAELGRLLGWSIEKINADRAGAARKAADLCQVVVLLKGQGTLIAAPDDPRIWINPTGTPGMAPGGSGDVLAGLIGGLLAQGLSPLDAAKAGAWLHGLAGDLCAARLTATAMNAEDIAELLPEAFAALHLLRA